MDDMRKAFPELFRTPFKHSSLKSDVLRHKDRFGVEHDNVIAREVGCHPSTVGKYRKALGIEPRPTTRRRKMQLDKQMEEAVKGLIRYSFKDIDARFGNLTGAERKIVGSKEVMDRIAQWADAAGEEG